MSLDKQLHQKCEIEKSNLFAYQKRKITTGISLHKYQIRTKKNYNKVLPDSDEESDESNEMDLNIDDENI